MVASIRLSPVISSKPASPTRGVHTGGREKPDGRHGSQAGGNTAHREPLHEPEIDGSLARVELQRFSHPCIVQWPLDPRAQRVLPGRQAWGGGR